MEKTTLPPSFVKQADQEFVEVATSELQASKDLLSLGFSRVTDSEYRIPAPDENGKAQIFSTLRKMGFCFARGREWSPAELFEYFRDRGLITGQFTEIAWTRPTEWRTRLA